MTYVVFENIVTIITLTIKVIATFSCEMHVLLIEWQQWISQVKNNTPDVL